MISSEAATFISIFKRKLDNAKVREEDAPYWIFLESVLYNHMVRIYDPIDDQTREGTSL